MRTIEDDLIFAGTTIVVGIVIYLLAHNSRKDWKKRQKLKKSNNSNNSISDKELNTPTFDEKTAHVIWSLIFITVAIMIIVTAVKDFIYYLEDNPTIIVEKEIIHSLKDNDFAKIFLDLDRNHNSTTLTYYSIEYHLVPFRETDNELFFVIKGPLIKGELDNIRPPFSGRISTINVIGKWHFYDHDFDLDEIFKRNKIKISPSAKILYLSNKEFPGLWLLFISVLSILYLKVKFIDIFIYLSHKLNKNKMTE